MRHVTCEPFEPRPVLPKRWHRTLFAFPRPSRSSGPLTGQLKPRSRRSCVRPALTFLVIRCISPAAPVYNGHPSQRERLVAGSAIILRGIAVVAKRFPVHSASTAGHPAMLGTGPF